jgi:hypothetical protein
VVQGKQTEALANAFFIKATTKEKSDSAFPVTTSTWLYGYIPGP